MKLMRVGEPGLERPAVQSPDGAFLDLSTVVDGTAAAMVTPQGIARIRAAVSAADLPVIDAETRIGAPILPPKIVCIGLNYRSHAEETGAEIPVEPIVFLKASNTIVGPNDQVLIPRKSVKTDWEVELGVVIGTTARYLPDEQSAMECIAGYVLSHDVSEREFQLERGGQWDKGKSCETFNPLGPYIATPDEIGDPAALGLRTQVNGRLRQDGNTSDLIFTVPHLIWYLSQFMVLEPGDVINTGTPSGVALGLPDQPYLRAGDVVELSIDGLGSQRQECVQAT